MKTISKIICVAVLSTVSISCTKETVTASNEVTTKAYPFSGYSALDVSDNFNVYVTFSDTEEKLEIEANDNLHNHIDLTNVGNRLHVALKGIKKIKGKETLNVIITTKNISDFRASGNSKLVLEDSLDAPKVKINLIGNAWFTGTVNTDVLDISSKGNCIIELAGNAEILNGKLSGNCELSDYGLAVEALKIDLSGNSNAYLSVLDSIDIDAKGNSVLSYKGNATIVHQNLSSGSKIVKKE
ncbi:MAG TPA: DUF2807 domain-containing protein [Pricia sp.]|nr:DUF2807 domain-containing protein [Pricia sp.]